MRVEATKELLPSCLRGIRVADVGVEVRRSAATGRIIETIYRIAGVPSRVVAPAWYRLVLWFPEEQARQIDADLIFDNGDIAQQNLTEIKRCYYVTHFYCRRQLSKVDVVVAVMPGGTWESFSEPGPPALIELERIRIYARAHTIARRSVEIIRSGGWAGISVIGKKALQAARSGHDLVGSVIGIMARADVVDSTFSPDRRSVDDGPKMVSRADPRILYQRGRELWLGVVVKVRSRFQGEAVEHWEREFNDLHDVSLIKGFEDAVLTPSGGSEQTDGIALNRREARLQKACTNLPSAVRATARLSLAEYFLSARRPDDALRELSKAERHQLRIPRHYLSGHAYASLGKDQTALEHYRIAGQQADFRRGIAACAKSAWKAGKGTEAANVFNAALPLNDYTWRSLRLFAGR